MSISTFDSTRAQAYDQFIVNWFPDYQYVLDLIPRLLNTYCHQNRRILVAGCGSGNDIISLLNSDYHWDITGIDPSKEMLNYAMNKIPAVNAVTLNQCTVEHLDLNAFGAATSVLVLHLLPDDGAKLNYLNSLSDRLLQNAPLAIVDIFGSANELESNLDCLVQKLPDYISDDEVRERVNRIISQIHYIPEDRLNELLLESGFRPALKFFNDTIYGGWITRKI